MKYTSYSYPSGRAEVAAFVVTGGVTEYHVMIHATDPKQTYREQMNVVLDAYAALLKKELSGAVAVFKRYFLSDAANQAELLLAATAESSDCALSVVEQPPLDGTKIALWAYLQTDVQKRMERAIELLAATGHQAVAAVSHGAAINVLLAGLTNHEIGTGKTRLYNGAINVIEGSQTGGFHVLHCNLPPDDPKTRQILLQDR